MTPSSTEQLWAYAGEEFATLVRSVLDPADRLGGALTAEQRDAAGGRFLTAARDE